MKRYLLDTGIAGRYVNRRNGVLERVKAEMARGNRVGIGITVLAELYFGIEFSHSREKSLQRLRVALPTLSIWPFTDIAAVKYGEVAADLRRRGRTIQQNDIQIAAIALTLGRCTVVSMDNDLKAVEGLVVENWIT